jgi:hypothetical protein
MSLHHLPEHEPSESERLSLAYEESCRKTVPTIAHADLIDDLAECAAPVAACLAKKDFITLGRIVWNVRAAHAWRIASREVYGSEVNAGPTAEQAAAMALYGETL